MATAIVLVLSLVRTVMGIPCVAEAPTAKEPPVRRVRVLEEIEKGTFEPGTVPLIPGHALKIISAGRFHPGRCDELLVWDAVEKSYFTVAPGNGGEIRPWKVPVTISDEEPEAFDVNLDGATDLVVVAENGIAQLLSSNGKDGFAAGRIANLYGEHYGSDWVLKGGSYHSSGILAMSYRDDDVIVLGLVSVKNLLPAREEVRGQAASGAQLIGTVFDGIGNQILLRDADSPELVISYTGRSGKMASVIWAELPRTSNWPFLWIADLNADLRSDLLAFGGGTSGWWLFLGSANNGLGARTDLHLPAPNRKEEIFFADVDCNGSDDAVLRDAPGGVAIVSRSSFSRPLPGVEISDRTGATAATNLLGEAELPPAWRAPVALKREGYYFLEAATTLIAPAKQKVRLSSYFAGKVGITGNGRAYSPGPLPPGPRVCLDFRPWSRAGQWSETESVCPPQHGMMSIELPKGRFAFTSKMSLCVGCCPLPYDDVLTDETVEADDHCPPDMIATALSPGWGCTECTQRLICTKINTKKYRLGKAIGGTYWGAGRLADESSNQVLRSDMPQALRYGVGRITMGEWSSGGCLGMPWGAVLTRRPWRRTCDDAEFRQILYAEGGDGPEGTPVPIFPDCAELEDPLSPMSGCATSVLP